jgi:hypothetical protein
MTKLEEGKDKSKGGCPNPQDRGHKAFPLKHHPSGLQNTGRHGPNSPDKAKGSKSR